MHLCGAARAFTLFFAALAVCAAPAAARRGPADDEPNSPAAIRALHDFARCVAHSHYSRARAREVLAMDYRTQEYRDAIRDLAGEHSDCLPPFTRLRFNLLLFAGGLAEALLPEHRDLATLVAYDPARPAVQARDEVEMMSLCAVRGATAGVAALLATIPASEDEAAVRSALAPQLGQCLRAGARMRLNPLEIRALLALAAWRLSEQNAGPRTASAAGPQPAAQ
jgi:hypothetical protein